MPLNLREHARGEVRRITLLETVWKVCGVLFRQRIRPVYGGKRGRNRSFSAFLEVASSCLWEFPDSLWKGCSRKFASSIMHSLASPRSYRARITRPGPPLPDRGYADCAKKVSE